MEADLKLKLEQLHQRVDALKDQNIVRIVQRK